MRTETSWQEERKALSAARVLAEFANLESDDRVAKFRAKHPDFFPDGWWDYRPTDLQRKPSPEKQWQIAQKNLRDAWLLEFKMDLFHLTLLLLLVFDPEEVGDDDSGYRPPFPPRTLDFPEAYPYHHAVQWLTGSGWRAKTCQWCGRRFISESPKGKFCTFGVTVDGNETTCFWAHRKKYKNEKWVEHSDGVNKRRRREYQLAKRNRRGHAKRQNLH